MAIIRGTSGADHLTGSIGADSLYGFDGNDSLDGGEGADVYDGGEGGDLFLIWGLTGADRFLGGRGLDAVRLSDGVSTTTLDLGAGASVERLDFMNHDLTGTAGTDNFDLSGVYIITGSRTIWLNAGDDRFTGSLTDDDVHGGAGDDRLDGGDGNDILEGAAGDDVLMGGDGDDRFILRGDIGIDDYDGGAGTDRIVIAGSAQTSRFVVTAASYVEILRFESGTLVGTSGHDDFDLSGIMAYENRQTIDLGAGNDALLGSATADAVYGNAGNDFIDGGMGNDALDGGEGNDVIIGGDGNDRFLVWGRFGADVFDGGSGIDTVEVTGGATTSALILSGSTSIEVLRFNGYDLTGTDGADRFDLGGIMSIIGGRTIWLNGGDDVFSGSQTSDDISGGGGQDIIDGGGGHDVLDGGDGDDVLSGGTGHDIFRVQGDFGADVLRGGDGIDTLRVTAPARTSFLMLDESASVEILAFTGNDLVGTDGADRFNLSGVTAITGKRTIWLNGGDDIYIGSRDGDLVHGGSGNDRLQGGLGADVLDGGGGRDVFIYADTADSTFAGSGRDRIDNFSRADGDRIDLSAIDARPDIAGDQAFSFIGRTSYEAGLPGQLKIVEIAGGLMIYADADGDGASEMTIFLSGIANLTAADFIL